MHDLAFDGCSNVSSALGQKKEENIKHQNEKIKNAVFEILQVLEFQIARRHNGPKKTKQS